MKLESHNVLQHILGAVVKPLSPEQQLEQNVLDALANPPDSPPAARERDGLPVIPIDGVKCAVDVAGGVIKAGEGREQRWFEVRLRDVTPRHLLTPEEQCERNKREAEHEDWWLVSSSKRSCFVRADSRHMAIDDFLRRFPGEAASGLDMPEAELARGFDFIDDEGDRIRAEFVAKEVMEQDPVPPEPPIYPQAGTPAANSGVGGCAPGQCSCGGCYPDPTAQQPQAPQSNLKPEDFYFGIGESPDGAYVCLVPRKFWDAHHCIQDEHLDVQRFLPPYFECEDMEATWMLPDGKMGEDAAIDMVVAGFERSEELELILKMQHEGDKSEDCDGLRPEDDEP